MFGIQRYEQAALPLCHTRPTWDPSVGCDMDPVLTSVVRVVGEAGLEPAKAMPADLQSAPFAARDIPPTRQIEANKASVSGPPGGGS